MARQIYAFNVVVPTTATKLAPSVTSLAIPTRQIDEVQILVPPGPSGQVGFSLAVSGVPIIPYNPGMWIVADDELVKWPLDGYPDSGAWSMMAYNTGAYSHTLYVRFLASLVAAEPIAPGFQPLSPLVLAGP